MPEVASGTMQAATLDRPMEERLTLVGEQLTAVQALSAVVALAAGAGSGKTTVLVERFLNFVTIGGLSPLNILAITYTERAAAEMRERIIRRFQERGDESNRRRAEAAYISTIHGLCARLLRENPIAAGIDPGFQIVDDMRLGFFMDEERERLLSEQWYLDVMGLFARRGSSGRERIFELVKDCAFRSREFGKMESGEESSDVDTLVGAAMQRLDEYVARTWQELRRELSATTQMIATAAVSGPKSVASHLAMCDLLVKLSSTPAFDVEWAETFLGCTGFTRGVKDGDLRGSIKEVTDPARSLLKDLVSIDRSAVENFERDVIAPLKVGIYHHAGVMRDRYDRMKAEHSLLDFDDLQRLALELLGRAEVRAEYASRFQHILLDEAQDTNPIQKAIIDALRGGKDQCLFAVGDVKQSVYGFRGADVSLFNDMHRGAGSGRLHLQDNYRSRQEIIDFINSVGRLLWPDGDVIEYTPLVCRFGYEPVGRSEPHVEMLLIQKQPSDADAGGENNENSVIVREREALALAMRVRRIVDGTESSAPLTVYDRHSGGYRPARYEDIAILARARTHFGIYERVFSELGVPVVADGGRGFFSGREVQDILAALRVIANPYDEVAVLAVLRSPLFGWSDADLVSLRHVSRRGLWEAVAAGFQPTGKAADGGAYGTLCALRGLAHLVAPVQLMHILLERTGYDAALLRTGRGRIGVANVQKLLEFARQSANVDGTDLDRFIKRAELAEGYLSKEREASIAAEGEDVVLLSTIHGSKGLEWPVVILAGLDAQFDRSESGSFYSAADAALVLEPRGEDGKPRECASQLLLVDNQKKRDEQEARRLFYVGVTRAREYLVLSGHHAPSGEPPRQPRRLDSPIKWLCAAAALTSTNCDNIDAKLGAAAMRVSLITEDTVAALRVARATHEPKLAAARLSVERGEPVVWPTPEPDRVARIAATVRELSTAAVASLTQDRAGVTTVTQLVYFARCPMVYYFNLVLQIEEHPRKRRGSEIADARRYSAVELGTIVHEMLERADFGAPPSEEAQRLVSHRDNTTMAQPDRDRVERMLASVLADSLIDRARAATRLEREYPFYLSMNGALVHGVIDLVFTDANGRGVVIDYKSNDLAAPDRVNILSQYYEPQIEMYALAADKAGLVHADEAILYFLNRAVARTFPVDARRLEKVEAGMVGALSRISASDWDTEPGEKCRTCGYRTRGFCEVGKRFVE